MKRILALALVLSAGPAAAATLSYDMRFTSERFFDVIDPSAADLGASAGLGPVVTDGRARGLTGPFADLSFGDVVPLTIEVQSGEITDCAIGTRDCPTILFSEFTDEDRWSVQTLFDVLDFNDGTLVFVEDDASESANGLMWTAAEATFAEVDAPTAVPVIPAGALLLGALPFLWLTRRRG